MSIQHRNTSVTKRKQLQDITNSFELSNKRCDVKLLFPNDSELNKKISADMNDEECSMNVNSEFKRNFQNVHPLLPWYKHDLETGHFSYEKFQKLVSKEEEESMLDFLVQVDLIAENRPCLYCGGNMRRTKDGKHYFWKCTRRVNGIKCNRGKKSIRDGTIFDNSNLSTQTILTIIWHFVHHLDERQCANYTNISQKCNNTVIKWYKFCREVVTEWFWNPINTPKLGGFGKIVEMDESYFPGKPKFNRGRRLGEDAKSSWEDDEKWVFAMTERDSLDAVAVQVPSNRSRKDLLPHIDNHCLAGSIFCSDGWKAYNQLKEHLNLEDVLHYSVNHSENYVDPETGAHTQTVEGFWRQLKSFLPTFGLKPKYLRLYLGNFLWYRYCKQRKLDMFLHILKCISETRPLLKIVLPIAQITNGISISQQPDKQGTLAENAIDVTGDSEFDI